MPPPPRALSRQLRLETGPDLRRRRRVFGLSLLGTLAAQMVSLFQAGLVRRLPDPPVGPFDSDRVDASDYACSRLETPDGALMLVGYGVTAALAAAGGADRAERHPALPLAPAAKTGFDAVSALRLAGDERRENRAFCAYCQAATVPSLVSLALAPPEAGRAWRALTR
jgi:Vitamin K epoxide reductase family